VLQQKASPGDFAGASPRDSARASPRDFAGVRHHFAVFGAAIGTVVALHSVIACPHVIVFRTAMRAFVATNVGYGNAIGFPEKSLRPVG